MKKFTFKGVLDGFRSSVTQPARADQEIVEILRPDHFQVAKTFRHGFPFQPTALAFDPIQHLIAIGTKTGSLRIVGRPGVDSHVRHESDAAVVQIQFLVNEGALVTATTDDTIHLWNFRQKRPEVVHSLKFARERITFIHLPLQSKWLYVGTEKGNIHVVNIESFVLSGYVVNWNKAIEVCRKTHPGPVVHLSDNPLDPSKLLIGYETGQVVLWDLRTRTADLRWQSSEPLRSISWHHEGKQFMCSHTDGSLTTWAVRQSPKPINVSVPHAKTNKDGKLESCKPIQKVEWKSSRSGEAYVIFSGGLTYDKAGRTPSITVIHGKTTTVLEMEHNVVDFVVLCESPWTSDFQDPYAIVVLLHNDLVVIDLLTPGYPCFENPYPMDLHESPVTCCHYLADCPSDLIPAFYSVGSRTQKRSGFSEKEWPVSGGEWSPTSCSYNEIILTGHADGSVKFWDASAGTLQVLYKLKSAKVFEKPRSRSVDSADDDLFAIQMISLCPESRKLCIAGTSGHIVLFKFRKQELLSETFTLEIPIVYEIPDDDCSPEYEYPPRPSLSMASKTDSGDNEFKKSSLEQTTPLRVRQGPQKKPPGFQAYLVCLTPYVNGELPGQITALTLNSSYGLMAYGNESGLVVVDIIQKVCLMNCGTPDLYGAADPYQRVPRSPKKNADSVNSRGAESEDRCRSPSTDQASVTKKSYKHLEAPVVSRNSSPITSPACKFTDSSEMPSAEAEKLHSKDSQTPISCLSNMSSRENTPDVEVADVFPDVTELLRDTEKPADNIPESSETTDAVQDTGDNTSKEHRHGRRRSSAWKAFSLKKQLSRVDQKLKHTFSADSKHMVDGKHITSTKEKHGCTTEQNSLDCINTPAVLSPVNDVTPDLLPSTEVVPIDFDRDTMEDLEVGKEIFESLSQNTLRDIETPDVIVETLPTSSAVSPVDEVVDSGSDAEVLKSIEEQIIDVNDVSMEESEAGCGKRPNRPMDLPLFDAEGKPIRPPRRDFKKKSSVVLERAAEKRDARLLSVPNIKYQQQKGDQHLVHDLRQKEDASPASFGNLMRRLNKLDSSFSRSRSSSMSSLENISSEAIQCLAFADAYTKKSDAAMYPTLWVGTSLGSVLTITVNVPAPGESRITQPVVVSPCGTIFRLKGCILTMSFLDCNGALIPYSYETWRDENKDSREKIKTPTKSSSSSNSRMSPTLSCGSSGTAQQPDQCGDRQFVVFTSEKQARVVALPSQNCVYRQQLADTDFVIKAEIISLKDSVCLVCYVSNGHITAYSLPSLRPLIDIDFVPLSDLSFQTTKQGIVDPMLSIWGQQMFVYEDTAQIARTFCFSNRGHGLFLCSPTEVQKFTVSSEFAQSMTEMVGELFLPHDMPEAPKEGFFKGLFGGGSRSLDREELFGEASGRASRTVAKHIPGPSAAIESLDKRVTSVTGEVGRAHQLMVERGEKLGQLEARTEKMMTEAENYSQTAHSLMLKYKDKKWYQL